MSGGEDRWLATVSAWANAQPDIKALVQIGSRVQAGAVPDVWSDFDYQLITSKPARYRDGSFTLELGPCWAHGLEPAFGDITKVTAVYEGALEADFVILSHAQVALAFFAMRWPFTVRLWPRRLVDGVYGLRRVAGGGSKVIKGGMTWEKRYARLTYHNRPMVFTEFSQLCGQFWVQLVWAAKKAERGEYIASQRTVHRYLVENCLRLYQEEALLEDRPAHPLGRRAETWMPPESLARRRIATAPDRRELLQALVQLSESFSAASDSVAIRCHWTISDYGEIKAWLAGLAAADKA